MHIKLYIFFNIDLVIYLMTFFQILKRRHIESTRLSC
jgi:hypothetical protein